MQSTQAHPSTKRAKIKRGMPVGPPIKTRPIVPPGPPPAPAGRQDAQTGRRPSADLVVAVQKREPAVPHEPINANNFFKLHHEAIESLSATNRERVELFKPLVRRMLNEGFCDAMCRLEFVRWLSKELDRYE